MCKPVYRLPGEEGTVHIHMKNNSSHGSIIYERMFFVKCKILDGGISPSVTVQVSFEWFPSSCFNNVKIIFPLNSAVIVIKISAIGINKNAGTITRV